ncbi:MAG TPA: YceH family protein [Solirubrobacteraceae bacterium]|nr:YceH family protein [Solirubrobacteraceae bacterium]
MSAEARPFAGTSALSFEEVRVLGCLLEKQKTTPDAYPLSLNALRLACNQTTNREPVVQYDEQTIREALRKLERRGYVRLASGAGSRAVKYRHLLADVLPLGQPEQALLCTLMLRGPQTPGELKQRSERMHAFGDLASVLQSLEGLIGRGLVRRLERRPGHKEERYVQLLDEGEPDEQGPAGGVPTAEARGVPTAEARAVPTAEAGAVSPPPTAPGQLQELLSRVERLEREVAELQARMRHPV